MYNGIGLATPRGSGTNGYVQRNLALSFKAKEKGGFKAPNEINTPSLKRPNTDIIEHDRKRKIEVKCLEFQSMLEDQGYSEEEIEKRVQTYRESLLGEGAKEARDKHGRIIVKETHEIAEAQLRKNAKLREAFGISEYFVEGTSFDPERHTKEAAAKSAIEETKKYALIPSPPSSEDESALVEKPVELTSKSKKKKKVSASPPDPSANNTKKKKKKKKHKRKSASVSNDDEVSSHKSKPDKEIRKQRRVSPSPTKTKHRKRNDESIEVEMKKSKKKKQEKPTEDRSHKSRVSRSSSPYGSDVDSANDRKSHKKKRKRSNSVTVGDQKNRSLSKTKRREREKIGSLTPEWSAERSKEVNYQKDVKKHSRNKSEEQYSKYEKADSSKHHRLKRKSSPDESDRDEYRKTKISDKMSSKVCSKESSRSKKSTSDRKRDHRSPSVERRKEEYKSVASSSKRKRHDSSSDREYVDKRSRRKSTEKYVRDRGTSRDKYSKSFYGKKTRLTVSNSESDRSSPSPDRNKIKSKLVHKTNKVDVDRYKAAIPTKNKNHVPSRRDSDYDQSSEENSRHSRKDRRVHDEKVRNESSKVLKSYFSADKSKSSKSDSDRGRLESVREGPKLDRNSEIVTKTTTPSENNDHKSSKPVSVIQRNGVGSILAAENGRMDADANVCNRDGSSSSSLSYSPMEKYPHRYKDILSDVSKKNQKSDVSVRRSEIRNRVSPAKSADCPTKDVPLKLSDKEKPSPMSLSKTVTLGTSESKSSNLFCLNDVPLPPESGSSSTQLSTRRDDADNVMQSPNKPAKANDLTSVLGKSISPSVSQKPNTLASSISDVISKSRRKRDSSTSSSDSSSKRRSHSSSSSSSSDLSRSSGRRSDSDSSSSSSRSSSRSSTRRRSRKSSLSDRSSSSSSSDSSRSRSRGRNATINKKKRKKRTRLISDSDGHSYSSSSSSSRSRSISIPRRKGSPSFLERRRITSRKGRKRSPSSSSSSFSSSSSSSSRSTSSSSSSSSS